MDVALDFVKKYRDAPVEFVKDILRAEPYDYQAAMMEAVADPEKRKVSVRSGHGVGKTCCLAWMAVWHIVTRFPQKTVMTAPTSSQLFDALYSETKTWMNRLPDGLRQLYEAKSERIDFIPAPTESFISARTSRPEKPEAMAGVHAHPGWVLLIGDEASGIPDPVFEAASGSMSDFNATTVLAGNPVRTTGLFYQTHTSLADYWDTYHISCLDSPMVADEYVEEMKIRYGEDSNAFRVRVLGEFPKGDDDTVIPVTLIDSAVMRDVDPSDVRPVWGVDVARFGSDSSALCKRFGNVVPNPVRLWQNLDTMQLTGALKAEYDAVEFKERPEEILVDSIGIGAGVVDRLRELGLPVRGINVSESPTIAPYTNLRAELWHNARAWLERRDCKLPDDQKLRDELAGPRYKFTSSGKIQIESKNDMKKRGLKSPNAADAFILTFASNAATMLHGWSPMTNKPLKRGLRW